MDEFMGKNEKKETVFNPTVKAAVKVSHSLIAVGAVELESHCILGTADERQSLSLSFRCLIFPSFEKGTHLLLGRQTEFFSHQMAKPSLELMLYGNFLHHLL